MVRLQEQLKYFVVKKITTDSMWRGLRIYLSGHEVSYRNMNPSSLIGEHASSRILIG